MTRFEKGGSRGWRTTKDLTWGRGRPFGPENHNYDEPDVVPEGFEFESSVPWWATWFLDPDDPHFLWPACIHDWYLENGFRRQFADSQWFEAALYEYAPPFKRNIAYILMFVRGRFNSKAEQ